MPNKFIYSFFSIIIIFIFIYHIAFLTSSDYSISNPDSKSIILNSLSTPKEYLENFDFHYNSNATFSWPLFGYYTISSYFGNRVSPTNRCINISFWY